MGAEDAESAEAARQPPEAGDANEATAQAQERGDDRPDASAAADQLALEAARKPYHNLVYHGPPPPPPPPEAMDKLYTGDAWPAPMPDMPKIISLDVKCEKNSMKVRNIYFTSFQK